VFPTQLGTPYIHVGRPAVFPTQLGTPYIHVGRSDTSGMTRGEQLRIFFEPDFPIDNPHGDARQFTADARTSDTMAGIDHELCPVRTTQDQGASAGQELIRLPVQWMSRMRTSIHIAKDFNATADNESAQRPVAAARGKGARAGIGKFTQATDPSRTAHRYCKAISASLPRRPARYRPLCRPMHR